MMTPLLAAATTTAADATSGPNGISVHLGVILAIIAMALVFDFLNGFHDAANSIATIVSTRVLTPSAAVVWAAFFNFVAAFAFGTGVAATIGKGLVDKNAIDIWVVCGGLTGAIVWNIIT